MKKFLALLALVAVVLCAVVTCPDKQTHESAIRQAVEGAVDDMAVDNNIQENALTKIVKNIATGLIATGIDVQLDYHNYFVFSTCKMKVEGEKKTVSLGLFNHIFTMDKDDILEALGQKE